MNNGLKVQDPFIFTGLFIIELLSIFRKLHKESSNMGIEISRYYL